MKQPHIKVETVHPICLISGNPDRVPIIASYLEDAKKTAEHRGLIAYEGFTPKNRKPVSVLTTGMGGPTTAIVLEEAYNAGGRIFIRIGSCGSLVAGDDHPIGTIYIPQGAIRAEGTSPQIVPIEVPAIATPNLQRALLHTAKQLNIDVKEGLVVSSDIYYSPDGSKYEQWVAYDGMSVEMESAVLFSYSRLKQGMQVATILTSDGNLQAGNDIYDTSKPENSHSFEKAVENTIKIVIQTIDDI